MRDNIISFLKYGSTLSTSKHVRESTNPSLYPSSTIDEKSPAKEFVCYQVTALPEGTLDDEHEANPNNLDLAGHSLPQIEFEATDGPVFSLSFSCIFRILAAVTTKTL